MAGQDVRQLLLQVDASVALAQRNLNALGATVDRETREMERKLQRPEDALAGMERAFATMNQVVVASANQRRAFGMVLDQVTAKELQAAAAIGALARATAGYTPQVTIATREQLQAAAAIGGLAMATNRLQAVQGRAVVSQGQFRAGTQQLGFQIGDVAQQISLGISPLTVFAQQSGQVIQAVSMMQGTGNAFLRFLGGPWGAVITGAVIILASLTRGLFDTRTEVEKAVDELEENARKADITRQAHEAYGRSLPGVIEAIEAETRALQEQNRSLEQNQRLVEQQALAREVRLRAARAATERELAEARESLRAARQQAESPALVNSPAGEAAVAQAARLQAQVAELEERLRTIIAAIPRAQQGVRESRIPIAVREAEAMVDPIKAINQQYDRMIARAISGAQGSDRLTAALARQIAQINRLRAAALEAEGASTTGQALTIAEASAIARQAGGRVTSGTRTREEQAVLYRRYQRGEGPLAAPPGRSAHERGAAIDIAGLTLAQVRAAFRDRVSPGRIIEEINPRTGGRHIHVPLSGHGAAQDAARDAEAAGRERLRAARNDEAFAQDLARANQGLLQARNELNTSTAAQADLAVTQLEMERARLDSAIQAEVTQGRYTQAEADRLKLLNEQETQQRIANVRTREADDLREQQNQVLSASIRSDMEIEQLQGRLADTAAERSASQLRLLDASQRLERIALMEVRDSSKAADWQKEIARAQLSRLDLIRRLNVEGYRRDNEGPWVRYMRGLRSGAANVNEELQELDVRAMQALDDSTRSALKSMLGLHGALGDIVADLAMIFIRQQLLLPFAEMMNRQGGGQGGFFAMLASTLGAAGSGPSDATFNSIVASNASWLGRARAAGGPVSPGQPYLVGERGPEIVIPKMPGVVIPNHMLGGGGTRVSVQNHWHLNAQGADAAALGQLQRAVEQGNSRFEQRVVATVKDAIQRRVIK